jgi:pimeloyl-ACP methyl ester carboxylesterase
MEAVAHTLAYEAAIIGPGPVPVRRFASISTPTLVLLGSQSPTRMQTAATTIAGALPNARLHTLQGQAHGRLDPQALGSSITDFFTT